MADFDIGKLVGTIELDDKLSSGFTVASEKVKAFGEHWDGTVGKILVGAGIAVAAIGTITAGIVALANHGSDVNDVTNAFDRLAGGVDNAHAILEAMREGTKGAINDFELMKIANQALESGVKADANTFKTMTEASRVLSKEGFGPLPDVLANINRGFETGLLKGPMMKSLHVDLTAAEDAYAHSLGKTSDQLNPQQKLLADRGALVDKLAEKVGKAGIEEKDFAERFEGAGASITNWMNKLASSIAASPKVNEAFDAIGRAISKAFGGDGSSAIDGITKGVEKLADVIVKLSPVLTTILEVVGKIASAVGTVLGGALDRLNKLLDLLSGKLPANATGPIPIAGMGLQIPKGGWAGMDISKMKSQLGAMDIGGGLNVDISHPEPAPPEEDKVARQRADDLIKQMQAINQKIYDQTHGIMVLTDTQKNLVPWYQKLGLSNDEMAKKFGVSITAVNDYTQGIERAQAEMRPMPNLFDMLFESMNKQIMNTMILSVVTADFKEKNRLASLNQHDLSLANIETEKKAELKKLEVFKDAYGSYYKDATDQVEKFYQHQKDLVEGTADTIVERMRNSGIATRDDMRKSADEAFRDFGQMRDSGKFTAAELTDAWKKYQDIEFEFFKQTHPEWVKQIDLQHAVADGLINIGQTLGGFVGQSVTGIGTVVNAWTSAEESLKKYSQGLTEVQKLQAILNGFAAVAGATASGNIGQRVIGGALAGASAGASIGASFGIQTAGISVAVGALAGAIVGWVRAMHEAEEEIKKLTKTAIADFGSIDNLLKGIGSRLTSDQFNSLPGPLQKNVLQGAIEYYDKLNGEISKLNLTFADLTDKNAQINQLSQATSKLRSEYEFMTHAGYSGASVIAGMADDINSYLHNILISGQKIPPVMEEVINGLIKTGKISQDNAALMLGLKDASVPSLNDIADAAGRYGLTLDDLGPKVHQLKFTEDANQIVKDFGIMEAASVPFETIMKDTKKHITDTGDDFDKMTADAQAKYLDMGGKVTEVTIGMHNAIQKMVLDSMGPLGTELPDSMKKIIQQMIDTGGDDGLVDQFGNKLTDLSGLHFEKPLVEAVDALIAKLDTLIDRLIGPGGVSNALTNAFSGSGAPTVGSPAGSASGTGQSEAQSRHLTINTNVDGRTIATAVVPYLDDAESAYTGGAR